MDIVERIAANKDAYLDWHGDPRTLEIAKLARCAECHVNDHGIFSSCPKEVVAMWGRAIAEVGICRVTEGYTSSVPGLRRAITVPATFPACGIFSLMRQSTRPDGRY